MKKRMLTMLLALMLIVSMIPFAASAATKVCDVCDYTITVSHRAATCKLGGETVLKCDDCGRTKTETTEKLPHTSTKLYGKNATCTETGLTAGSKCSVCNEILTAQTTLPKVDHQWVDEGYAADAKPTCTEGGAKILACSVCGTRTRQAVSKVACEAKDTAKINATCTTAGQTAGTECKYCGKTMSGQEVIPARGHSFDENYKCTRSGCGFECKHEGTLKETAPAKEATCTAGPKTAAKVCTLCGYEQKAKATGKAKGHAYVDGKCTACGKVCKHDMEETASAQEATCVTGAITAAEKCKICDYEVEAKATSAALGHKYDNGTVTKAATCTAAGEKTFRCSRCMGTYTEVIPAQGHRYSKAAGVTANCMYCPYVCKHEGNLLVETTPAKAATCTTAPFTAGVKCTECNYEKAGEYRGEGLGHKLDDVTITATCTASGRKISKCTREGCNYSEDVYQAKLEHEVIVSDAYFLRVHTEPGCALDGVQGKGYYKCSRKDCTSEFIRNIPDGECEIVVNEGVPATCTSTGWSDGKWCKYCKDKNITVYRQVTEKLGHDLKLGDFISTKPTCLDKGWGRYECQREGCEYTEGGWVPATGHHYEVVQEWNATCTVKGCKKSICEGCNLVRYEDTAPLGHDMKNAPGKEASCTEDGYTAHKKCALCDLTEGKEAIAAGHEIVDYQCRKCKLYLCDHDGEIEIVESTCSQHGTETFSCETCGYEHTKELPLAAHTVEVETTAATCTEAGVTRETCSVCDKELTEIVIPATGHNFVGGACTNNGCDAKVSTDAPSTGGSTSDDTATDDSENSGDNNTPDNSENSGSSSTVTPACGHTHQNTVKQDNSCTTSGSVVTYCTDCNTVVTSQVIDPSGHKYSLGICQVCNAQDPAVYTNDFNNYYIVGGSTK